ncbi:MAG: porin PorA family protein [Nitrosarchaeum sp.]
MLKTNKLTSQISILFLVSIVVIMSWMFVAIPNNQKLSEIHMIDMEYEGENQVVDNVYGQLSEPFLLRDSLINDIISINGNELTIKSTVSSKKASTNEKLFGVENVFKVDAISRKHLDRDGSYFEFFPGVEKKNYDFFHPAVFFDDPMTYKGSDSISGIDVYVFETVTTGKDISHGFPQFSPHVIFTDTTSTFWIEPTTGNTIRFEKTWENYLVENGNRINTVELGRKYTSEFIEHMLIEQTLSQMNNYFFNTYIMPFFFIILISSIGSVWITSSNSRITKQDKIKLEEKEKLKDELVSMLSHEIKNPLTPILNSCDQLLLEKDGNLNEKQRKRIEIILKNCNSINELLNDFIELKKFDLNEITLSKTEIDLKEYLENVLESIRPFTGQKNIHLQLKLDNSWKVICDQKRIAQVISNLVKNAIDFVPAQKGKIIITAEQHHQETLIIVEDNGIGIPSNDAEIIFDKFQQLVNPNIKHEGTGLGLTVCRGIVEAHGGKIWLDTEYRNGARFVFSLPST